MNILSNGQKSQHAIHAFCEQINRTWMHQEPEKLAASAWTVGGIAARRGCQLSESLGVFLFFLGNLGATFNRTEVVQKFERGYCALIPGAPSRQGGGS